MSMMGCYGLTKPSGFLIHWVVKAEAASRAGNGRTTDGVVGEAECGLVTTIHRKTPAELRDFEQVQGGCDRCFPPDGVLDYAAPDG